MSYSIGDVRPVLNLSYKKHDKMRIYFLNNTMLQKNLSEFIDFIREKGVLGLAVGIIMGGAVTKIVSSLVENMINPLIGAVTGAAGNLNELAYTVPFTEITFKWGAFVSSLIDFLAIVAVVYFIFVKTPILAKLDKKTEDKK